MRKNRAFFSAQYIIILVKSVFHLSIARSLQGCRISKFGTFELLVQKETFADTILRIIVSKRSSQNSPLESSNVVVALTENHSTSKPLKASPEKSKILSCDTVVANERYIYIY